MFLFSGEIHAGIVDPVVKDAGQDKIEAPGYDPQVLERKVAHAQLVVEEDSG